MLFHAAYRVQQKVIAARMNDSGYLTCLFTGYEAFSDTFTGVTRAATAASSLDKVIAVFRKSTYNDKQGAVRIVGTQTRRTESLVTANNLVDSVKQRMNEVDVLTQPDCAGEEYLPAPMNFSAPMQNYMSGICSYLNAWWNAVARSRML